MAPGELCVGADAARRANDAASFHPLIVPALRAWPTSGCSGWPVPRASSRSRPPLIRGLVGLRAAVDILSNKHDHLWKNGS